MIGTTTAATQYDSLYECRLTVLCRVVGLGESEESPGGDAVALDVVGARSLVYLVPEACRATAEELDRDQLVMLRGRLWLPGGLWLSERYSPVMVVDEVVPARIGAQWVDAPIIHAQMLGTARAFDRREGKPTVRRTLLFRGPAEFGSGSQAAGVYARRGTYPALSLELRCKEGDRVLVSGTAFDFAPRAALSVGGIIIMADTVTTGLGRPAAGFSQRRK